MCEKVIRLLYCSTIVTCQSLGLLSAIQHDNHRGVPIQVILFELQELMYHSAGKHDRGPLFFTLFSFRLIRSCSTGSI